MGPFQDSTSDSTKIAVISTKLDYLTTSFEKFDKKISQNYISREEHVLLVAKVEALEQRMIPLQRFVYGLVTLVMVAVVGAVLKVIIR